jgi:hypothetical protein
MGCPESSQKIAERDLVVRTTKDLQQQPAMAADASAAAALRMGYRECRWDTAVLGQLATRTMPGCYRECATEAVSQVLLLGRGAHSPRAGGDCELLGMELDIL